MFDNIDLNDFWEETDDHYRSAPFSDELLRDIENELGYKLPASYIYLMHTQNGGCPKNTRVGNTGYDIDGIYGISKDIDRKFWTEDAGCPKIGVPICTHYDDWFVVFLDYSDCGNDGEPRVAAVDLELHTIDIIAKDFEAFIEMLSPAENEEYRDPYEAVQFTPVKGKQKIPLLRVIWHEFLLCNIPTAILLLICFFAANLKTESNILLLIGVIFTLLPAFFCILTVVFFIKALIATVDSYKSYVDTVEAVWEEECGKDEKELFLRLKKSSVSKYPNPYGFKEGDKIRVYISKKKKEYLIRELE